MQTKQNQNPLILKHLDGSRPDRVTSQTQTKLGLGVRALALLIPSTRPALLTLGLAASIFLPAKAQAAVGVTSSGGNDVIDTGGGLVFNISQSTGDMKSLVYAGKELQSQSKSSQIDSGFGSNNVSASVVNSDYIRVTVTNNDNTIKHYYLARRGYNNIYMQTYTSEAVGELRYIARLSTSTLPNGPAPSDIRNNAGTIESGDVFVLSNGQTRSKYFGRDRAIFLDDTLTGATGSGAGHLRRFRRWPAAHQGEQLDRPQSGRQHATGCAHHGRLRMGTLAKRKLAPSGDPGSAGGRGPTT